MKPKNTICLPTSGNFFQRLWRCRLAVVRMARTALAGSTTSRRHGVSPLLARWRDGLRGSLCPTCAAFSMSQVRIVRAASPALVSSPVERSPSGVLVQALKNQNGF